MQAGEGATGQIWFIGKHVTLYLPSVYEKVNVLLKVTKHAKVVRF